MSKQSDAKGELTWNPHDKHPHRRKVQRTKAERKFLGGRVKPMRLGAVHARKHLSVFPIRERRKGLPLSERNQVTIGEFVYKRSRGRLGSPLYGKWYKLRKGESAKEAIAREGSLEAILVDSPPVERKAESHSGEGARIR